MWFYFYIREFCYTQCDSIVYSRNGASPPGTLLMKICNTGDIQYKNIVGINQSWLWPCRTNQAQAALTAGSAICSAIPHMNFNVTTQTRFKQKHKTRLGPPVPKTVNLMRSKSAIVYSLMELYDPLEREASFSVNLLSWFLISFLCGNMCFIFKFAHVLTAIYLIIRVSKVLLCHLYVPKIQFYFMIFS